jgi:hypothetical protein
MVSIELPTNEQLEQKFNELSHTDEIEKERAWFWSGIAAYCQLVSEAAAKRLGLVKQEEGER